MTKNTIKITCFLIVLSVGNLAFCKQNNPETNLSIKNEQKNQTDNMEIYLAIGTKTIFQEAIETDLPTSFSFVANMDYKGFLRFHAETTHFLSENNNRSSLGVGAVFGIYGKNAPKIGGLQIKVPLIAEIGFFTGEAFQRIGEPGSGNHYELLWLIYGPSTGIDFTIWKPKKMGIYFALKTGLMFFNETRNYNLISETDNVGIDYNVVMPELSFHVGIAF